MRKALCLGLITALIMGLCACAINVSGVDVYEYDTHDFTVATGDVAPTETIDEINIDWLAGNVHVVTGTQNTVIVHESGVGGSANVPLCYRIDGATLTIAFAEKGTKCRNISKNLTVTVPQGHLLTSLNVDSVAATVFVDAATEKDVRIDTVSGRVECSVATMSKVKIGTVSGNVNLRATSVKDVEVGTISGTLNLNLPSIDEVEVESVSGDVNLALSRDASFTMKVDTVSGNVNTGEFACTRSGKRYISGTGKASIEVDTTSGDVTLKVA